MITHFDLTDVAAHASSCRSLTGIQRVQLEYVRSIAVRDNHPANFFANLDGAYVDLGSLIAHSHSSGSEAMFMQMRGRFGLSAAGGESPRLFAGVGANGARTLRRAAAFLRHAFVAPRRRFGPSDRLYVGGAFWAHPRSVSTYEQAARDGCDVVVLFHDVLPVAAPHLADGHCRPLFERMLRLEGRALTISRHSQAQIERARRAIGAPGDLPPATVVPLAHEFSAAPRNFLARQPPSLRLAALEGAGSFVLCVGSVEARKNQLPLLGLWEALAREMGPGWPRLVVAGKPGWRSKDALRALRRADATSPYVWIDTPTDEELAWLYSRARFTVFPSLAEGWGLPIGESLWFGKPCVASRTTSMPEVGGALCAYADPHAIDSFAEPIIRLVRDGDFHDASVSAIRAARLRTWKDAADALVQASSPLPASRKAAPRAVRAFGR